MRCAKLSLFLYPDGSAVGDVGGFAFYKSLIVKCFRNSNLPTRYDKSVSVSAVTY